MCTNGVPNPVVNLPLLTKNISESLTTLNRRVHNVPRPFPSDEHREDGDGDADDDGIDEDEEPGSGLPVVLHLR
eukprot:IDg20940t1